MSALIDRLIVENIKLYFFNKESKNEEVTQEIEIISEIKKKLITLLYECVNREQYKYLSEKRTFKEESIVENIEELISNNIRIGEGDRARLEQIISDSPDFDVILHNEKITRKSNEGRARNKNEIDKVFKKLVEE